uniref:Ig-like domain-containing protein n=1 Tax=Anisakis simplex TaxID=6269 RepID=A0A0M3JH76_ANISI
LFWILPNGTRIDVVDSATDSSSGPIFALATHQDGSNATFGLNVSHSQLVIPEVHKGMDGRYVCVMEDAQQRVFFIPYVISSINFSQSLMVSLSVAVCFAIACLLVLIFDRYCKSLLSVKICCSNGGGDNYDRNRNLSSDQLSISDHTSPIQQRKQQRFAMNHMNFVVDDEISTKMDSSSRCSTDSNNHSSASMKSVKDTDTYNSGNNSDDNDKDRHVSNSITNSTVLSHELTIPVSDSIHL